jgi:hypothetical protein
VNCKNCNTEFQEGTNFCPQCGQSTTEKLTLGELFRNTISNYFSVDARLFKSIFPLLFRPGFLPRQFINGKRTVYLHPAQLYLFFSVIFFFLLSLSTRYQSERADEALEKGFSSGEVINVMDSLQVDSSMRDSMINQKLFSDTASLSTDILGNFDKEKVDSLHKEGANFEEILQAAGVKKDDHGIKRYLAAQSLRLYLKRGAGFLDIFYGTIAFVLFISIPIFALFLKLLYFHRGPYVHHLVFTFDFFAVLFIGLLINIILIKIAAQPSALLVVLYMLLVLHLFLSLKFFFQQKWLVTVFKLTILLTLFSFFLIPLSIILTGTIAFLIY